MQNHRIPGHRRPMRPWVALLATALVMPMLACGPTVFEDKTALTVIGDPPPPPPKPEVVEAPKRVKVTDNAVEIDEKIEFEQDKAVIREVSFSLLKEVAEEVLANPHIKKISIEGHASAEGDTDHNLDLSKRRAKAVMEHLIKVDNIPEAMLTSKGWGESKPIASNDTEEGREDNRRVEFIITDQDVTHKKVEVDPETGEETVLEEKTTSVEK